MRSEFLLRVLNKKNVELDSLVLKSTDHSVLGSNTTFLQSRLRFVKDSHGQDICLAQTEDGAEVGVMMGWEKPISTTHCALFLALPEAINLSGCDDCRIPRKT